MRSFLLLACLGLSAVGLAGCTSSGKGIDALGLDQLRPPSQETTSSIPRPNVGVAQAAAAAPGQIVTLNDEVAALADVGMPPVKPSALVGARAAKAVAAAEEIALVVPDRPAVARST